MSRVCAALFGASMIVAALAPQGAASERATDGAEIRRIDLRLGQGVASIAARHDARGFIVGFAGCRIILLDRGGAPGDEHDLAGCKTLFTVRPGRLDGSEAVVASTYIGRTAVISGRKVTQYKVHDAAVTDSHLVGGRLLSSSDDGSVRQLALADGPARQRVLTSGAGVARVLLLDPAGDADVPAFFAGFDTGRIRSVAAGGAEGRTYESGVGRINALGLSSDRRALFVAGFDGRLREVDLASGRTADLLAAGDGINALAVDRIHERVGVVSDGGYFLLLDLATGEREVRAKLAEGAVTALAFDETGSIALAGDSTGILHRIVLPNAGGTKKAATEAR